MSINVGGRVLETDEEGFLEDPEDWDLDVANVIAAEEQIQMSEDHWTVVNYVRDYYNNNHSVPEARVLLKYLADIWGKERATRKQLYLLFPYGYGQQACKIAGMRKPRKLMLDV